MFVVDYLATNMNMKSAAEIGKTEELRTETSTLLWDEMNLFYRELPAVDSYRSTYL